MASRDDIIIEITPQVLLKAYTCGIFPMAESAEDPALYWIEPQQRGILLLDQVHVPRRLARTIRRGVYEVRIDSDFEGVIDGCAASRSGRRTTWINRKIRGLYRDLFDTSRMRVTGAGQVDFDTEQIYFRLVPTPKKPQFLSLATPVQVTGTITDFKIGVSASAVLETTARLFTSIIVVPLQKLAGRGMPVDGADVCANATRGQPRGG